MTVSTNSFFCMECGSSKGTRRPRPDLTWKMAHGIELPLPVEVPLMSCNECNEAEYGPGDIDAIEGLLRPIFIQKLAEHVVLLVATITKQNAISSAKLEKICGVSAGYLSKLQSGDKNMSVTIVRLLESFASHPSDVERHLRREGWTPSSAVSEMSVDSMRIVLSSFVAPWSQPMGRLNRQQKTYATQPALDCANDDWKVAS